MAKAEITIKGEKGVLITQKHVGNHRNWLYDPCPGVCS